MAGFSGIPTHFDPEKDGPSLAIQNHIHPASRLFQAGGQAGFSLRELEERFVDAEWVSAVPKMERFLGWPITHLWVFEKKR